MESSKDQQIKKNIYYEQNAEASLCRFSIYMQKLTS